MKTLRDASVQGEVRSRIESLTAEDAARWGKMSVHQMICHLRDSYGVGLAEKKVAMVTIPMPRAFMKRVALQVPIEWRKGFTSAPELAQDVDGTALSSLRAIERVCLMRWSNFAVSCRSLARLIHFLET